MNFEHLRLFVRLAYTHKLSQAGEELGLSPAVASSYISKLEANLGARLVHRTTRKMALTEEGMAFLPEAERVLASVEQAKSSLTMAHQSPSGTLRVTAPASFGRIHLVPALTGFMREYPKVHIDLRLSDTMVDLVAGGFDLAIRSAELKDSNLVARKLANDTRVLCAAPGYLARFGHPETPLQLKQHNCLRLVGLEQWSFAMATEVLHVRPQGSFRTDDGEAIRDACVDGLGIALCSRWIAYQQLQQGTLVPILLDYPVVSKAAIWALYPSSQLMAPKVRAFIDYFAQYYGEPAYWES
ncbi:MAG: LysR family transcriptional regulator [Ferrimonas sp.]